MFKQQRNLEQRALAALKKRFRTRVANGYTLGKMEMRDFLVEEFSLSRVAAESLLDRLCRRGLLFQSQSPAPGPNSAPPIRWRFRKLVL